MNAASIRQIISHTCAALLLVCCFGCSQQKNTVIHRSYHNLTARYNGYFNAKLAMQEAYRTMKESYQEDYTKQLPLFIYLIPDVVQPVYPQLERTIKKTSLVIDRHSMEIGGKEYCKWIDDTWLLMGEAEFLKGEYTHAKQIFEFTKRKYDDPAIKQLSRYWLARIYTQQELYTRASDELRKISVEDGFPEKLLGELYAFRADYQLRQGRIEKAIEELERSVEYTRNRDEKSRRMFILAQLYKRNGDSMKASDLFAQIVKRNPDYTMAFYAKINRALAFDVGGGNVSEVRETLFKMLKDDKNAEFRDEIYYALADLEFKEGDEAQGVEYLELATRSSVRNGHVKGLAFYRLGEIYFNKENYERAQAYYDSTVTYLSTEHPDYDLILARANSLTQMMRDIDIVQREDSLQAIAKLPREEIEEIIRDRIEKLKEEEEEKKREEELKRLQAENRPVEVQRTASVGNRNSDWYFYNPTTVAVGAAEFKRQWGNRKNEDNWRRSDKTSIAPLLVDDQSGPTSTDTLPGVNDPKNENYYWAQIPDSEEKLARSNALIIEALYDLALVYKDQMNDPESAIETFEELISRYDTSKYHATAYYQLYLMYSTLGNTAKADYYKAMVLEKYPDSEYAMAILNPNFAGSDAGKNEEIERTYEGAYEHFKQGWYTKAFDMSEKALETWPNSALAPQFAYLRALCLGYIDGEERMINELETVAEAYRGSEAGKEAGKLADYLKNGRNQPTEREKIEEEARQKEMAETLEAFTYDIGASHNFVVVVPDTADVNKLQTTMSNFNRTYFSTKGFKTSTIALKGGRMMIIVSSVGTAVKAMDYLGTFENAKRYSDSVIKAGYPYFIISYDNYATFYKNPDVDAYMLFFKENYKKTN